MFPPAITNKAQFLTPVKAGSLFQVSDAGCLFVPGMDRNSGAGSGSRILHLHSILFPLTEES